MKIPTNRIKFLKDTLEYFNITNLGRNEFGGYSYSDGCAIGRWLEPNLALELDEYCEYKNTSVMEPDIFTRLPQALKKLGKDFLVAIQHLHDDEDYWAEDGLSAFGKKFVNTQIIECFEIKTELL